MLWPLSHGEYFEAPSICEYTLWAHGPLGNVVCLGQSTSGNLEDYFALCFWVVL